MSGFIPSIPSLPTTFKFDGASSFVQNKYAIVSQNEKIGIIDKEGKYKVNPQFKDVGMMVGLDSDPPRHFPG